MRIQFAPPFFSLFLCGILAINLACGSQNPLIEKQKGEIDYLTRENEELHRLLAKMEQEGLEVGAESVNRSPENVTTQITENTPSRVVQAETISDEKRIESVDDVAKPEITVQEDVYVSEAVNSIEPEPENSTEETSDYTQDEGDIIVESSQAPSYVDQPDLFDDEIESEEDISEEEAERLAWENRPRQRAQAPVASMSTRQFFADGSTELTRSAKIYLKLVATILSDDHGNDVIEIESQDLDDEPELLPERLNTVLQELEQKVPGIIDRVVLLDTPLTYSNSRQVEDPHHIKIYPVKPGDQ